eukprot:527063-Pleurochrysis_carterae.AAC.3
MNKNRYHTNLHKRDKRQTCKTRRSQVTVTSCDITTDLLRKRPSRPSVHDRPVALSTQFCHKFRRRPNIGASWSQESRYVVVRITHRAGRSMKNNLTCQFDEHPPRWETPSAKVIDCNRLRTMNAGPARRDDKGSLSDPLAAETCFRCTCAGRNLVKKSAVVSSV